MKPILFDSEAGALQGPHDDPALRVLNVTGLVTVTDIHPGQRVRIRVARREDQHLTGAVGVVVGVEQDHHLHPGYRFLPVQLDKWPQPDGLPIAVPVNDLEAL